MYQRLSGLRAIRQGDAAVMRCDASAGKILFRCLLIQLANLVDSCLQDPLVLRRLTSLAR